MVAKFGLAHEKHEHSLPEYGCSYYSSQPCRKNHQCCFFCGNLYKCQEGRCVQAWASMKFQPNPIPFRCPKAKRVEEIAWNLVFAHGSDTY